MTETKDTCPDRVLKTLEKLFDKMMITLNDDGAVDIWKTILHHLSLRADEEKLEQPLHEALGDEA